MPANRRSRAKGSTRKARAGGAKAGTQSTRAGTQKSKAAAPEIQGGTRKAKDAPQGVQRGARKAKDAPQDATAGTRNAPDGTQGQRSWFGPKGLGRGYRPQTWQGYLVMLVLGAYAVYIGTLAADHHTPLILLAIAPAAVVPRIITMIQQR